MKYHYYINQDNRMYRIYSTQGYENLVHPWIRMQQYRFDGNTNEYKWCKKHNFKIRGRQVYTESYVFGNSRPIYEILTPIEEPDVQRRMMILELSR